MAGTTTVTVTLDPEIDLELERQASKTGHTKPEVIRNVLAEWLLDQEDYREAARIAARDEPTRTSAEVRRRLGLDG